MSRISKDIEQKAEYINSKLEQLFADKPGDGTDDVVKAMEYSSLAGGKRIRPYLVLTISEVLGGNRYEAERFALAIELIHTYSLIHDDMPCMDNDDYRRGKLTCHKVYGEAAAMLAGDALLTYAFDLVSSDEKISPEKRIKAVEILSKAAGHIGMIGGQIIDLEAENKEITYEQLTYMHSLKTGALIKAACRLGCITAGITSGEVYDAVDVYAEGIGRVFQLVDDLLDVSSTTEVLGKPVHSDEKNQKTTYLSFVSYDMARQIAQLITEKAAESVESIDKDGILHDLAYYLVDRVK